MNKKFTVLLVCVAMLLCCAIGGTLAWLVDSTEKVTNTFTYGDINIDLDESDNLDLKMIPGSDITKDPVVTVQENSEASWLFVKIEKSANYGEYLADYTVAAGWTQLVIDEVNVEGVYYREASATGVGETLEFPVLLDNKVTVLETVEKSDMEAIKNDPTKAPTLSFTAYAVQKENINSVADAWAQIG